LKKEIIFKNTQIHYTDDGHGECIVFLHGFLENKYMWHPFIETFAKNFRVIAIDLLGHGKTGCTGYVHTMQDQAEVVQHVLQSLKISRATFVGHSMGGYVCLALAHINLNLFCGLVLLNSTAKADNPERILNRNRAIAAVKQNHKNFVRLSITNLFSENIREKLSPIIEIVKNEALKTPLQGVIAALEGMKIRDEFEDLLASFSFKTLIVLGEKDTVLPIKDQEKDYNNSNIKFAIFDGGHMSHIENKDALIFILQKFFKQ
jgi:pimeloyl-ACP methyl ester carboxylesterase